VTGPVDFFSSGWQPPLGSGALFVIYVASMLAIPCLITAHCRKIGPLSAARQ
jgi:hypothetical protein